MTSTNKILSFPKEVSGSLEMQVLQKTLPLLEKEGSAQTEKRKSKHLLSTAAPTLSKLQVEEQKTKTYEEALLAYMASVLISTVTLAKNQANITKNESETGSLLLNIAKNNQVVIKHQMEELSETPWWASLLKVVSVVASVVLVVAGLATGNIALAATAGVMLAMTSSGGFEKINEAIAKWDVSAGVKVLAQAGIAVGCAVAVAGAAAMIARALSAASTIANTGTSVGAGITRMGFVAAASSAGVADNMWGDLFRLIVGAFGASEEFKDKVAIVGTVVGSVTSGALALKAGPGGIIAQMKELVPKLQSIAHIATLVANLAQTGASLRQGVFMLQQAETHKVLSEHQAILASHLAVLEQNDETIKASQEAGAVTFKAYAKMNENWESYVDPLRVGVEAMA